LIETNVLTGLAESKGSLPPGGKVDNTPTWWTEKNDSRCDGPSSPCHTGQHVRL